MPVTVTEIWRYPVKSMGGERLDNVAVDERGMVADRMWAVRDPELGSITTARRRPALLRCGARYAADPLGSAPEVVIVLPDGEEISSADPAVHARLSELVGSEVRLEPIPPPSDKDAYRAPRETKAEIRAHFGLAEDEPLPDFSVFPLRKGRRIDSLRHASRFACRLLSGARDHSRQSGGDGRAHAGIRLRCSPVPA